MYCNIMKCWKFLLFSQLELIHVNLLFNCRLKEVHLSELSQYRVENEKFQHEIFNLKQMLTKSNERNVTDRSDELQKQIKEKDAKLHELSVTLRQIRVSLVCFRNCAVKL